jgi:hypothetical protein
VTVTDVGNWNVAASVAEFVMPGQISECSTANDMVELFVKRCCELLHVLMGGRC